MNAATQQDWTLVNLREQPQAELIEAVQAMWREEAGLSAAQIERRSEELLLAAVDAEHGQPLGVSTAYLETPASLRLPLWTYRTFVSASKRQQAVGLRLMLASIDWLENQHTSGADTRGRGVYMEIENAIINQHRNEAIWPRSRLAFAGLGPLGQVRRVRYFPGARLD